jgi:hypothetical protein
VAKRGEKMAAKLTIKIIRILNHLESFLVSPVLLYRFLRYGCTFRRIYLGEGKYTILNSCDYYRLRRYKWFAVAQTGKFYAHRFAIIKNTFSKQVSMHREIMNAPKNKLVDHHDSNSLNNTRMNLRFATHRQNICNKKKTSSKTTSRFRGIYRYRKTKWVALIKYRNKRIWLGTFLKEIDAAKAYDRAARKYFGQFARLNFPDPPEKFPGLEYYIKKLYPRLRSWFAFTIKKLSSS